MELPAPFRTSSETQDLFDAWASTYDRDLDTATGVLTGYGQSLRVAASLVPSHPGARLLDVGVGTGSFGALVEAKQPALNITGIDPSPAMLRECAAQHPAWRLVVGSFEQLPPALGIFDVIVSAFAFHEVAPDDRAAALRNVMQHLVAGGIFCLVDIIFASTDALAAAAGDLADHWDPHEIYHLVADLDGGLRQAGCSDIIWRRTARCHWVVQATRSA